MWGVSNFKGLFRLASINPPADCYLTVTAV